MNPVARVFVAIHRRLLPDEPYIGWMPYVWLVFLTSFVAHVVRSSSGPLETAASWIALAAFLVLYFRAYWVEGPRIGLYMAAITAIALAFTPVNYGAVAMFIYAASFAGAYERPRHGALAIGLVVVAILVEMVVLRLPMPVALTGAVFSILIGTVNVYYAENERKNAALRLSQEEVRRLAATAERERIARDLHDLLGHTLSVITLKAELASRLIDTDVERASKEIREVEQVSREALREVRTAVAGYRTGLATELANARRALEAADIEFAYQLAPEPMPPRVEEAFSMILREGVTNIVRHAGARRCRLHVSRNGAGWEMELSDDGRGGIERENSGLSGLRERLHAVGGSLTIRDENGVTLRAEAAE